MERLDCVELSVAVSKNFGCGQALSPVHGEAKPGGSLRGHTGSAPIFEDWRDRCMFTGVGEHAGNG